MSTRNWAGLVIILQFLDGLTTYIGVKALGPRAEGNPLIRYAIENLGPEFALVSIKLLAVMFVVALYRLNRKSKTYLKTVLVILSVVYINVVAMWIYAFWNNSILF